MRGWDGKVTVDAVAPTLVTRSRAELMRLLLGPKLGSLWKQYQWFNSSVALEKMLISKPQRWVPQGHKDFDAVLAAAVEAAVDSPEAPRRLSSWRWGKVSKIDLKHPLFGAIPGLTQWTGTGSLELSGDGSYTVKAAGKNFGASERMTVDLSDLDGSTLNIVVGQSGQILSPYYMDQFTAWYKGTTFALAFSPGKVRANAHHQLTLEPE
jgi:penicillin amidase